MLTLALALPRWPVPGLTLPTATRLTRVAGRYLAEVRCETECLLKMAEEGAIEALQVLSSPSPIRSSLTRSIIRVFRFGR
eukprot:1486872-Rhodomonas_salina.2